MERKRLRGEERLGESKGYKVRARENILEQGRDIETESKTKSKDETNRERERGRH